MKVNYKISIGYPQAARHGEVLIDEEELDGLEGDERNEKISEIVWEDAIQHVDCSWDIVEE